jgi:hypothetical protein
MSEPHSRFLKNGFRQLGLTRPNFPKTLDGFIVSATNSTNAAQLDDFVLDARGDLTILALQLAQFQEFARGFGRVTGYITADRFDVFLDISKLLCEEDSQRFLGICAHTSRPQLFLGQTLWRFTKHPIVNRVSAPCHHRSVVCL